MHTASGQTEKRIKLLDAFQGLRNNGVLVLVNFMLPERSVWCLHVAVQLKYQQHRLVPFHTGLWVRVHLCTHGQGHLVKFSLPLVESICACGVHLLKESQKRHIQTLCGGPRWLPVAAHRSRWSSPPAVQEAVNTEEQSTCRLQVKELQHRHSKKNLLHCSVCTCTYTHTHKEMCSLYLTLRLVRWEHWTLSGCGILELLLSVIECVNALS